MPFPPPRQDGHADAPLRRLRYALALLAAVIIAGAMGYHLLSRLSTLDSFYMAITTLSSSWSRTKPRDAAPASRAN